MEMRNLLVAASVLFLSSIELFPQWSTDPNNNLIVGYGLNPELCSDSAGGCYITYEAGWQYLTTTTLPTYEDPTESYCPPGQQCMSGHNVSHANNKTKRRFLPNLQRRKFWVESEKRWISLRLTNAALRTIDKNGIEAVLADMRSEGKCV